MFVRERTPTSIILYGVYLVFEGLSLRAASRVLKPIIERSHVALWGWLQGLTPLERLFRPKRVTCFLVDETMVKIHGVDWVWVAYEPNRRRFLALDLCWTGEQPIRRTLPQTAGGEIRPPPGLHGQGRMVPGGV